MSPLDIDTAMAWRGRTVIDRDGEKIGTLGEILLDSETDTPAWGGVRTGLFGRKESYLPLDELREIEGEALQAPFDKQQVVAAPGVDPDVAMTAEEEATLFRHYGREDEPAGQRADEPGARAVEQVAGREDEPAARRDDEPAGREEEAGARAVERGEREGEAAPARADERGEPEGEMVRSEEEVRTGTTEMRPTERVRLKKVLVTDEVKRTVPVRREEIRLETDPPPQGTVETVEDAGEDERR
jgi:hypothetical protein